MSKKKRNTFDSFEPESDVPLIPAEEVADWIQPVIEVIDDDPEPIVSVSAEPEIAEPVAPPIKVVLLTGGGVCPNCHCFYVNDSKGAKLNCKNCSKDVELI